MKTNKLRGIAIALFLAFWCVADAADFDVKGATPGKWTMDLDAAAKVASEKKLPILLFFAGSDWCRWCRLMEEKVFSQQQWREYAKDSILLVLLDFPQDKSLVPQQYLARNEALREKYKVEGFPAFVVLDDDAKTVLGRLGAGEDTTAESFVLQMREVLRYRDVEVEKYAKTLKSKDRAEYLAMAASLKEKEKAVKAREDQIKAAQQEIEGLQKGINELRESAAGFRAARLGAEALKEYKDLKARLEAAMTRFTDWINTGPERNPENDRKYSEMTAEISELQRKLSVY